MILMGQIKINKPGLLTTVQDLGRYGYQQFGVSVSGAMDHVSARIANILVGNDENEGLLEVTMLGPEIEFMDPIVIAITGGDLLPLLNGQIIKMNKSILVNNGDILSFNGIKSGCRSYIAFAGGIEVSELMGSKSTFTRGSIGGFQGRALKQGDILTIAEPSKPLNSLIGKEVKKSLYEYSSKIELRVIMGPQDDAFTEKGIETFFNSEYKVTNQCDRMGYRLEGEKVEHKDGGDIISDGIAMGAVQVPSHGNPVIMMADRQTTGGYTKIGNVINVDLPKIAQAKPGDTIIFKKVELEEAHRLLNELENNIDIIKEEVIKEIEVVRTLNYKLKVNGVEYNVQVEEIKS